MDISVKEEILSRLMDIRGFQRSSLGQYHMRCLICGDSKKDPHKKRLYFRINTTDESPILYCCHNCGSSGILTSDVLRTLNIRDISLAGKLTKFNKESIGRIKAKYGLKDKKLDVKVPVARYTTQYLNKKKYIEDRLGVDMTFDELVALKCIFSLHDFANVNKIDRLTVDRNRAIRLERDYVGFLTMNNEYINFRDTTNSNKLRYDKYTIIPELIDTVKMCAIPTSVEVLTTESITINIAEGVFDMLGIYYNVEDKKTKNTIYVAVCGSGYMNVVKHFIKLGFIGSNITINIYSDSDKDPYFHKKVIEYARQWVGKVNLIYNNLASDCGVPKEKIQLRYVPI